MVKVSVIAPDTMLARSAPGDGAIIGGLRQGSVRRSSQLTRAIQALGAGLVLAMSVVAPAAAYIGPGAGLSAIGLVLAMAAALGLAVVGFVWYPVKRLLRRRATAGRFQDRKPTAPAPTRD